MAIRAASDSKLGRTAGLRPYISAYDINSIKLLRVKLGVENYPLHSSDMLDFERTISYDTFHTIPSL